MDKSKGARFSGPPCMCSTAAYVQLIQSCHLQVKYTKFAHRCNISQKPTTITEHIQKHSIISGSKLTL